jgi:hypothetical protein
MRLLSVRAGPSLDENIFPLLSRAVSRFRKKPGLAQISLAIGAADADFVEATRMGASG